MCWWVGEWIGIFEGINYGKIKRKRMMIFPWTLISWAKNHSLKSLLKVSNERKVERNCNTQTLNLKYVSFEAPLDQDFFDLQFPTCHGVESRPKPLRISHQIRIPPKSHSCNETVHRHVIPANRTFSHTHVILKTARRSPLYLVYSINV